MCGVGYIEVQERREEARGRGEGGEGGGAAKKRRIQVVENVQKAVTLRDRVATTGPVAVSRFDTSNLKALLTYNDTQAKPKGNKAALLREVLVLPSIKQAIETYRARANTVNQHLGATTATQASPGTPTAARVPSGLSVSIFEAPMTGSASPAAE